MNAPPDGFYEEMAKHCRCCRDCAMIPCAGCCAGGMCDQVCVCDDIEQAADYTDDD